MKSHLLVLLLVTISGLLTQAGEAGKGSLPPVDEWEILRFSRWYNGRGKMVTDHIIRLARDTTADAAAVRETVRTPEDWERRRPAIAEGLLDVLGGLPPATPLDAEVTGGFEREHYRVENVVYEQLPGFAVSANLYIPKNRSSPAPAIIAPCGHSGREREPYQALGISFASNGYVTLVVDSPDRGERGAAGNCHFRHGALTYLTGANSQRYFSLDVIRGVDYLSTRPEVDPDRIAATGVSGGAVSTLHAAALDDRIKCAVPVCGVIPLIQLIEIEYTTCPEQLVQNTLGRNIDEMEVAGLIAPRPLLLMQGERDTLFYVPDFLRGSRQIAHYYEVLGARDRIQWETFDAPHGYSPEMRQAALEWFGRWIGDEETTASDPETMHFATRDQLAARPKITTTIFSQNATIARDLHQGRGNASASSPDDIRSEAKELLGLTAPVLPLRVHGMGEIAGEEFNVIKHVLLTDDDIAVPMWILRPAGDGPFPTVVFVSESGAAARMQPGGVLRQLARSGVLVALADVRGTGETAMSPTRWDHHSWCDVQRFASYASFVVSRPLVGMRVHDTLCVLDVVANLDEVDSDQLTLWGGGEGGVWAQYAAMLDSRCNSVIVENAPVSYLDIATDLKYTWSVAVFIPHVLRYHDLPEVSAALQRPVLYLNPRNARRQTVEPDIFRETYQSALATQQTDFTIEKEVAPSAIVEWVRSHRKPD